MSSLTFPDCSTNTNSSSHVMTSLTDLIDDPLSVNLLPVPQQDETNQDVGGNHVEVSEKLGQDPGNVGK